MVNDTVRTNILAYEKTPAEYPPNYKLGDPLVAAEGGFRSGDRIIIDNPDDYFHGHAGVCGGTHAPRTIAVTIGAKSFSHYCVSSLRPA